MYFIIWDLELSSGHYNWTMNKYVVFKYLLETYFELNSDSMND